MRIHDIARQIDNAGHDYEIKSDDSGMFAIETKATITTAKKYIYQELASVQKEILLEAAQKGKDVVIYFQREDTFYRFDPDDALSYAYREATFNQRADLDETYADFPIALGRETDINDR